MNIDYSQLSPYRSGMPAASIPDYHITAHFLCLSLQTPLIIISFSDLFDSTSSTFLSLTQWSIKKQ